MSKRAGLAVLVCILASGVLIWKLQSRVPDPHAGGDPPPSSSAGSSGQPSSSPDGPTTVYAHNLMLRKGPKFRIYLPWLRGHISRSLASVNPSFDHPESFYLNVSAGIIHANIGDITNFLNAGGSKKAPLTNIKVSGDGDQVKIKGTLHKIVPLPVEIDGTLAVGIGNTIQIHVKKLNVLKIPMKALIGGLHLKLEDLFNPKGHSGIQVAGNDIILDTGKLLPPPLIRGKLTRVRIANPDFEEVYGDAEHEVKEVEQWRNFLRLREGSIDFGKLTMHDVDLTMIDISQDAWFDLDLAHYQDQLVYGYTRITPEAGLQIFMPDVEELPRIKKSKQSQNMEWLKDRNHPPPADVVKK